MNAVMLAHQGGWDEMLFVAVPIGAFAFAMRTANRRAKRVADQVRSDGDDPDGGTGDSATGYVDTER